MKRFFENAGKPTGILGGLMITGMNMFHARVSNWGLSQLDIPEPSYIAELGCGGGKNIRALLNKYPSSKVTGLDYSPLSLERARKQNEDMIASGRCELVEGDVSDLKLEAGRYDLATAFETIYFWPGLERCFGEVRRVLKDRGHFMIVTESDGKDAPSLWFEKVIDAMRTYTPDVIEQALSSAGFRNIETRHHPSHTWLMILAQK